MDPSIIKLHNVLLDAQLPSTIEDLKNPTEEFLINLLTKFLQTNSINVPAIKQTFVYQCNAMPYYEDSDVIPLINLYVAVLQILQRIFIRDFSIADITNPGQKRFRKQAKYISNFVLYTIHKKSKFNEKMKEIEIQAKILEELIEKSTQFSESVNKIATYKAKQLDLKKKLKNNIQQKKEDDVKLEKRDAELDEIKYTLEKENQKSKERHDCIKTKLGKITKQLNELQSQIVDSPETYQSSLDEFQEAKNKKLEERSEIQEAIQDKKENINQINEKLTVIQKITDEFSALKNSHKELRDKKMKVDVSKKQIDSLNDIIDNKRTKLIIHKDQMDAEMNEAELHREEDVVPLCDLFRELLIEKKEKKANLEAIQTCFNEKYLERNKLRTEIRKKEDETSAFIQLCQELYDKELAQEREIQADWKQRNTPRYF